MDERRQLELVEMRFLDVGINRRGGGGDETTGGE